MIGLNKAKSNFRSVFIVESALAGSVDGSNHVSEVILAKVHAGTLSEHAVVKVLLVLLSVVWGISNALTVFLFSVASPHTVDRLFTSQEIISFVFKHLGMANINTYTIGINN
tara:strand:+ start:30 stop:365 length:336 start_codon:yes stop_codon:yes gene_type:complete